MNINTLHLIAGFVAPVFIFIAGILYIWAILVGKIQSNKVTWGVWVVVSFLSALSYTNSISGTDSIWTLWVYFGITLITFITLVLYAKKGEWTWVEKTCLVLIIIPILLWIFLRSPVPALFSVLAVDVIGSIPLGVAVYKWPEIEYSPVWWISFTGNAINLLAVQKWDIVSASYPVYLALLTLSIAAMSQFLPILRQKKTTAPRAVV